VATLPGIAADQNQELQKVSARTVTTASEDDFVLGIYGNANEDGTIDMRDLTYVKLIFFGERPETDLADAKYDGEINPLDFVQIKLVIVGKEKELTIIDTAGNIVTIDKPLERIIVLNRNTLETMRSLKLKKEKIIGLATRIIGREIFFPEFKDSSKVGSAFSPDIEKILELHPDAVFLFATHSRASGGEVRKILEDASITAICLDCYRLSLIWKWDTFVCDGSI
jgi:iron complex transport system substrate-binding protein